MSIENQKERKTKNISNAFQELLLKFATESINTPMHQLKQKIENDFRLLGGFLDLDYIHLFEYNQHIDEMVLLTEWINHQHKSLATVYQNQSNQKYLILEHQQHKQKGIQNILESDTTDQISPLLEKHHIKACYSYPLVIEKKIFGFMMFTDIRNKRSWTEDEEKLIAILAEIIANDLLRKRLAKDMMEIEKQAHAATDAKNQFLSNMSHEIRTPLSGIYNAFYLLETTSLTVEQKEYLEIGQASIDALSSIVDDVLSLSKIESGKIEIYEDPFNMEEEMIRLLRMQKEFADEKAIQLHLQFDYRIHYDLIGDYRKLNQVISHLINNAIKYTDQGHVKLNIEQLETNIEQVVVKIEVIDTGIGVDKDQMSRLFDAFYQVDSSESRKQQGVGLGLPISNQLIQRLDGQLDIESQPNQGSIFRITIPLKKGRTYDYPMVQGMKALFTVDDDLESSPAKAILESMGIEVLTLGTLTKEPCDLIVIERPVKNYEVIKSLISEHGHDQTLSISFSVPQNKRFKKIDCFFDLPLTRHAIYQKIVTKLNKETSEKESSEYMTILNGYALIVDDNRLNRIALESILNKQGVRSKSVDSGPKAIEIVKKEDFDIILMDIQMPGMDGIETIRRIRNLGKKYQNIPMIAITANAFFKDYDMMKTARINDVIFKPIRIEHLNQVLRKYIHSGTSIHIPDELYVFDEKDFKQRFEGSDDIALEVVETFVETYKKDLQNIKTTILKGLPDGIVHTCHYFKGSCGYLSGKRAVWILNYMMDAAKNNQMEFMNLCYEMLESEVNELVKAIRNYKI